MKTLIIALAVLVLFSVVFEVFSRIVAKKEKERFDKMTPVEQRKYQEEMYKRQQTS